MEHNACQRWQTVRNLGTIYRISPSGQKTTLFQFKKNDGEPPELIHGRDGNPYDTAMMGAVQCGSIFKVTLAAALARRPSLPLLSSVQGHGLGAFEPLSKTYVW